MYWLQIKDISIENNLAIRITVTLTNQGKALIFHCSKYDIEKVKKFSL